MQAAPTLNGSLRVVIADDEPNSLASLRYALDCLGRVEVVKECASGNEVVELLKRERADLLFLDVQMPGLDGLNLARLLRTEGGPLVVFVTGFAEHAVAAFDLAAIDYVLKPFDSARLTRAIDRADAVIEQRRALGTQRAMLSLLQENPALSNPAGASVVEPGRSSQFAIRDGYNRKLVGHASIDWIEGYGNYARFHVEGKVILHREPMAALESRLSVFGFARIHRSAIVNLAKITEVRPGKAGQLWVVLGNTATLRVTRRHRANIESLAGRRARS